ncbi:tetratricopeptide repeat protein [Pseudoalteromonas denitrificans]|uniref:TolA-binding protein n=1 Tax=Pseudoalteromonas denitrificans DSM 6059 TaxID=1123010 RepID=A0A1I1SN27_9GAMM|nr:tetratricopeptide repeat protein [Pseudoalteromonas denitrificans]SFD47895.1 TolA-binding protein [Pseudoalteromonas denitrificans DSM 6059]
MPYLSLLFALFLTGCSLSSEQPVEKPSTLADLSFSVEPAVISVIQPPSLSQLKADYQALLTLSQDPKLTEQLRYRLAELELMQNEFDQEQGRKIPSDDFGYYDQAIKSYQKLIQSYPNSEHREHLLYQQAKAFELQGKTDKSFTVLGQLISDFPNSIYAVELYFRRGEVLFNQKLFDEAAQSYAAVINFGVQSPYYQSALYMRAWSEFKLEDHTRALHSFTQLLDASLSTVDGNNIVLAKLPKSQRELVKGALKVMSLIFSYQQGETTLAQYFDSQSNRHYEYLNYQALADLYLEKKRFNDSAQVLGAFANRYAVHQQAPAFMIKQIEVYTQGKSSRLATQQKLNFVTRYGLKGPYFSNWAVAEQLEIRDDLQQFLTQIAYKQYRNAQKQTEARVQKIAFAKAANWLAELAETMVFNVNNRMSDDNVKEVSFLLAESLFASEQYIKAIAVYAPLAYENTDYKNRAEAGYATLLSYKKHLNLLVDNHSEMSGEVQSLMVEQELSAKKFIKTFASDVRALAVLDNVMTKQFDEKRYIEAIKSAKQLLTWVPKAEQKQQLSAHLIIAHGLFNTNDFQASEQAYSQVLSLYSLSDERIKILEENLAASIYKQAETKLELGMTAQAIQLMLAVIDKVPNASIRSVAQYNIVQYLYQLKQFEQADFWLNDYQTRFSLDAKSKDITAQLADIYVQDERWLLAAKKYYQLSKQDSDPQTRRKSLYLSAQYFEKGSNQDQARLKYREYAHAYEQPFDLAIEVRFKLSEIYLKTNEHSKRRFWLNKLIQADKNAGEHSTERSTYLAAMSSEVFAKDAQYIFNRIKLTLPLKKSLKRKKLSLQKALKAYQKTASYGVAQFSTLASYQIAKIYTQLATDLFKSQRPKGLDELALEQYNILLEEQAYPFEDKAILIHESNIKHIEQGIYDTWVKRSFTDLADLMPGRYNKVELTESKQNVIF